MSVTPEPPEASLAKAVVAVSRAQVSPAERERAVLRALASIFLLEMSTHLHIKRYFH